MSISPLPTAEVLFYRSTTTMIALEFPMLRELAKGVHNFRTCPGEWPQKPGLYISTFVCLDDGSWSHLSGRRPTVLELAQIYDGTWTAVSKNLPE